MRFESFGIKLLPRAAIEARPVRGVSLHKRATDVFMPASEQFGDDSYLFSENTFVNSISSFLVQ